MSYKNITLTPAYGRDYRSAAAVMLDWNAEKDSVLQPAGSYCNILNMTLLKASGVTHVHFRYQKMTKVHVLAL